MTDPLTEYLLSQGVAVLDDFDADAVFASVRENRRRYARKDWNKTLEDLAGRLAASITADFPDIAPGVLAVVMVNVAAKVGALASLGVEAASVTNVIGYAAYDLHTQEAT